MNRFFPVLAIATLALGACTWVKMEPDAARVRVLAAAAPTQGCTPRGEIGVSVKARVGLYRRGDLKVRDELETLARNEAVRLDADSIQPLNEPIAGEQRFAAFRCGKTVPATPGPTPVTPAAAPAGQNLQLEEAETFPARDP